MKHHTFLELCGHGMWSHAADVAHALASWVADLEENRDRFGRPYIEGNIQCATDAELGDVILQPHDGGAVCQPGKTSGGSAWSRSPTLSGAVRSSCPTAGRGKPSQGPPDERQLDLPSCRLTRECCRPRRQGTVRILPQARP